MKEGRREVKGLVRPLQKCLSGDLPDRLNLF